MDLPFDDLIELESFLEENNVIPMLLPQLNGRQTREILKKYTSRIWLFPPGLQPNVQYPVQIWKNGLQQWNGGDVQLVQVGYRSSIFVLVFESPTHPQDQVQAQYIIKTK